MAAHATKEAPKAEEKKDTKLPSINTVTSSDFHSMNIPGFTGKRIDAIIDERDRSGSFESFHSLRERCGMIGERMEHTLEQHFSI